MTYLQEEVLIPEGIDSVFDDTRDVSLRRVIHLHNAVGIAGAWNRRGINIQNIMLLEPKKHKEVYTKHGEM